MTEYELWTDTRKTSISVLESSIKSKKLGLKYFWKIYKMAE